MLAVTVFLILFVGCAANWKLKEDRNEQLVVDDFLPGN
jgi:hypothetical protein